jgi:putative lipoprotein
MRVMTRNAFHSAAPRGWQIVLALGAAIVFQLVLAQSMLTGMASPREPFALPPGASLEVVLIDASAADAPAQTIGRTVIDRPGDPPWRFTVPFDPARIVPAHRYAVRATVRTADALLLTTDTLHPVLTQGAPTTVNLSLRAP